MTKIFADFQQEADQVGRAFRPNQGLSNQPNAHYYIVKKMEEGDIIADQYDLQNRLLASDIPMDPHYHQRDFHFPEKDINNQANLSE